MSTLQRHQSRLAKRRPELLSAVLSPRELVLLEVFDASGSRAPSSATARQRLQSLEGILGREAEAAYVMALGVALHGLDGVALSYQSACSTLRVGRQRLPGAVCFSYYELSLPVLLAGLGSGWRAEQLRLPLQRLTASDKRLGVLRRTLDAWFEHDGHPAATAKALHVHRNTLDYRLRRISEITGLDLSRTDDRLLLYISRQLE